MFWFKCQSFRIYYILFSFLYCLTLTYIFAIYIFIRLLVHFQSIIIYYLSFFSFSSHTKCVLKVILKDIIVNIFSIILLTIWPTKIYCVFFFLSLIEYWPWHKHSLYMYVYICPQGRKKKHLQYVHMYNFFIYFKDFINDHSINANLNKYDPRVINCHKVIQTNVDNCFRFFFNRVFFLKYVVKHFMRN